MNDTVGKYGLWALKIIAGLAFLAAGIAKLMGAAMMVAVFEAVGVGQWLRYITGAIEVGSAILLFVPGKQAYGAALLTVTMIGAGVAHVFILGTATMLPAVALGLISAAIAYIYRSQLPVGANA